MMFCLRASIGGNHVDQEAFKIDDGELLISEMIKYLNRAGTNMNMKKSGEHLPPGE